MLLGHLEDFIKRNETLVQEMNRYIELSGQLKEKEIDCSFSQLTALCGVYIYSAMRDWAVEAKRIIAEKGDDQS